MNYRQLRINDFDIEVGIKKVIIHDPEGVCDDDEATNIVSYLRSEGFIEANTVHCEIRVEGDDGFFNEYDE